MAKGGILFSPYGKRTIGLLFDLQVFDSVIVEERLNDLADPVLRNILDGLWHLSFREWHEIAQLIRK